MWTLRGFCYFDSISAKLYPHVDRNLRGNTKSAANKKMERTEKQMHEFHAVFTSTLRLCSNFVFCFSAAHFWR